MQNRLRWSIVTPLCLVASLGMVANPAPSACPATQASDWVKAHHDNLPNTLAELSKFSPIYQSVIVQHLDPSVRSTLWRQHFAVYLRPEAGLNEEQRSFVRMIYDSVPGLYRLDPVSFKSAVTAFDAPARSLFADSLYQKVFGSVAPARGTIETRINEAGIMSGLDLGVRLFVAKLMPGAKPLPVKCICNLTGGSPTGCSGSTPTCLWYSGQCDEYFCGWTRYCDGMCVADEE